MSRPGRIACCVPFCRRTVAEEKHPNATEIICGKHWRLLPKARRSVYDRALREARNAAVTPLADPDVRATAADLVAASRTARRAWRLWKRMKGQIIEAAAGIGDGP